MICCNFKNVISLFGRMPFFYLPYIDSTEEKYGDKNKYGYEKGSEGFHGFTQMVLLLFIQLRLEETVFTRIPKINNDIETQPFLHYI